MAGVMGGGTWGWAGVLRGGIAVGAGAGVGAGIGVWVGGGGDGHGEEETRHHARAMAVLREVVVIDGDGRSQRSHSLIQHQRPHHLLLK